MLFAAPPFGVGCEFVVSSAPSAAGIMSMATKSWKSGSTAKNAASKHERRCHGWIQIPLKEALTMWESGEVPEGSVHWHGCGGVHFVEFHVDDHNGLDNGNFGGNLSCRMLPCGCPTMMAGQDEAAFHQCIFTGKQQKGPNGEISCVPKDQGAAVMASSCVVRDLCWNSHAGADDLAKANSARRNPNELELAPWHNDGKCMDEDAATAANGGGKKKDMQDSRQHVEFKLGANCDGCWTCNHLAHQVKDVADHVQVVCPWAVLHLHVGGEAATTSMMQTRHHPLPPIEQQKEHLVNPPLKHPSWTKSPRSVPTASFPLECQISSSSLLLEGGSLPDAGELAGCLNTIVDVDCWCGHGHPFLGLKTSRKIGPHPTIHCFFKCRCQDDCEEELGLEPSPGLPAAIKLAVVALMDPTTSVPVPNAVCDIFGNSGRSSSWRDRAGAWLRRIVHNRASSSLVWREFHQKFRRQHLQHPHCVEVSAPVGFVQGWEFGNWEGAKREKERETGNWVNRWLGEWKRQTGKQRNGSGTRKCGKRKSSKQESVHKAKEVGITQLTGNWGKKGKRRESSFCSGGYFV